MLCSSAVIYFLHRRRIRLSKCQNIFIINIAISDVMVSLAGVFRGLGIIDSKYVGAPDNIANLYCIVYTIVVHTFASSGMLALLPLTIDRGIAITFPIRHNSLVTRNASLLMIGITWLPLLVQLLHHTIGYIAETITVEYYDRYNRCVIFGHHIVTELIILIVVPFFLILALYFVMLIIIVKSRIRCGRFLVTSLAIVITSLLTHSPSVITFIWDIPLSYEASQILTVYVYYTNGIINPLIYVATHPVARRYFTRRWRRGGRRNPAVMPFKSSLPAETVAVGSLNTNS